VLIEKTHSRIHPVDAARNAPAVVVSKPRNFTPGWTKAARGAAANHSRSKTPGLPGTATPDRTPTITGFSPQTGYPGSWVQIRGQNLVLGISVQFNGVPHRRALPLSALLYRVNPGFFEPDFRTIRQLGLARSFEEFGQEVNSFRSDNRRHGGLVRRRLRVRVSGRRLMQLVFTLPSDMPVAGKTL
jgi:hypothetical protein